MLSVVAALFTLISIIFQKSISIRVIDLKNMNSIKSRLPSIRCAKSDDFSTFVRENPKSDKFATNKFHHVEFYCGDATSAYKRFMLGLGMEYTAKSDQSTGNLEHASYGIQSGGLRMIFTAPYSHEIKKYSNQSFTNPFPGYDIDIALSFLSKHGMGVRAIAIEVDDVNFAHGVMTEYGGVSHLNPTRVIDEKGNGYIDLAEVYLYGDVVLRLLDIKNFNGPFLPNFRSIEKNNLLPNPGFQLNYKLNRFDHIVGNLWSLQPRLNQIKSMTGFHEFAEFTAEDVGTVDSGLNSVVLANNNEAVLLPLNEPTFGTRRKSQIQTYLEQNQGEGVQHMALHSEDIFYTLRRMRALSDIGGFEFMDQPNPTYYQSLRQRLGDTLSEMQYQQVEELGILADKDDEGVLLQIFTRPVGDRSTLFLEIIQRIGCDEDKDTTSVTPEETTSTSTSGYQRPGCGGFGKGNFRDLFKSIEEYEKKLNI